MRAGWLEAAGASRPAEQHSATRACVSGEEREKRARAERKYLRVHYVVSQRWPRQPLKFEERETEALSEIRERDQRDASRDVAPMKPADDAVLVDSSTQTIEQVVENLALVVEARATAK